MSLTSYRAAPPRVKCLCGDWRREQVGFLGVADLPSALGFVGLPCRIGIVQGWLVLGRPGNDLLSQVLRHSTIGAEEFNGRVRDGIGFGLLAKPPGRRRTGCGKRSVKIGVEQIVVDRSASLIALVTVCGRFTICSLMLPSRLMRAWIMRAIKPIERLVPVSSTRCRASTPGLSTWSSSTALKGELVLRWVSRLDAFSGYPVRT